MVSCSEIPSCSHRHARGGVAIRFSADPHVALGEACRRRADRAAQPFNDRRYPARATLIVFDGGNARPQL
jgi:hypothetical protein